MTKISTENETFHPFLQLHPTLWCWINEDRLEMKDTKNNLTLYCYPKLFGLPDNNPFGLKVDTYLRLAKIDFQLENILDTSQAPRSQLPYISHNGRLVSDSSEIIQYLDDHYQVNLDSKLDTAQKNLCYLIDSMLGNHLYWVIAYSRWQDERYWPYFKIEFLKSLPQLTKENLEQARQANIEKYISHGIGRHEPETIYCSGISDLKILEDLLGNKNYLFGDQLHTIDVSCYGFLANIFYIEIDSELKKYIYDSTLADYIQRIRGLLNY